MNLEPKKLLGLSQLAKVSRIPDKPEAGLLSRVLSKIGFEGPAPGSVTRLSSQDT